MKMKNTFLTKISLIVFCISSGISLSAQHTEIEHTGTTSALEVKHSPTGSSGRTLRIERLTVPGVNNDCLEIKTPATANNFQFIECDNGAAVNFVVNGDGFTKVRGLESEISGAGGILIDGDDTGDARLEIENGGGSNYIFDDESDGHAFKMEGLGDIAFNTGGVNERMRITSAGLLGIGTVSPSTDVQINGTNEVLRLVGNNNWMSWYNSANTSRQAFIYFFDSGSEFRLQNDLNGPMTIRTNSAERLRILGSGEVGIGTSTPLSSLHIQSVSDAANLGDRSGAAFGYLNVDMPSAGTNSHL